MSYANIKGADQLAHARSLISAFVVRCLDSVISLDSIAIISRLELASGAAQARLCLAWSGTPEDTFSRGMAQLALSVFSSVWCHWNAARIVYAFGFSCAFPFLSFRASDELNDGIAKVFVAFMNICRICTEQKQKTKKHTQCIA